MTEGKMKLGFTTDGWRIVVLIYFSRKTLLGLLGHIVQTTIRIVSTLGLIVEAHEELNEETTPD